MKKLICLALCGILTAGMLACNTGATNDNTGASGDSGSGAASEEEVQGVEVTDSLNLLTTVWGSYQEDEKFPIGGGDFDNTVMDAPGAYDVSKVEEMDSVLGLPADCAAMIDDAASIMHMMNANTFTCGAYHLSDISNQQAFADGLKDNIMNRQWMCGFPDTLIVVSVGDYMVSAFGNAEIIENFKNKVLAAYPQAAVMYEESLVQ